MDHDRDLARALAIGDCAAASTALDLMLRDEVVPSAEEVALGRADAARILREGNSRSALRAAA